MTENIGVNPDQAVAPQLDTDAPRVFNYHDIDFDTTVFSAGDRIGGMKHSYEYVYLLWNLKKQMADAEDPNHEFNRKYLNGNFRQNPDFRAAVDRVLSPTSAEDRKFHGVLKDFEVTFLPPMGKGDKISTQRTNSLLRGIRLATTVGMFSTGRGRISEKNFITSIGLWTSQFRSKDQTYLLSLIQIDKLSSGEFKGVINNSVMTDVAERRRALAQVPAQGGLPSLGKRR